MIVLGLDTATAATAAGLRLTDGSVLERRDDPPAGARPGHATRLLAMIAELLREAGVSWEQIERIAVGLGPGRFTGLRVGVATARGLAHSRGIELVGVSSLQALALGALEGLGGEDLPARPEAVLAAIDARRGEVFTAAYERDPAGPPRELSAAAALAPGRVAELVAGARGRAGGAGCWSATAPSATAGCSAAPGWRSPRRAHPCTWSPERRSASSAQAPARARTGAGRCPTTYAGPTRS